MYFLLGGGGREGGVVTEVLEDLGIVECQGVLVQDVSGRQRRRVSVGLELLANPRYVERREEGRGGGKEKGFSGQAGFYCSFLCVLL